MLHVSKNDKFDKPTFWSYWLRVSAYSEDEILATLSEMDAANKEFDELLCVSFDALEDENGVMDGIHGYASEKHQQLHVLVSEARGPVRPEYKDNGHEGLPVRKWQSATRDMRRDMKRINALLNSI